MSLSQATSPEEAKRELKQQVFLAIQGKYQPGKTAELTKDINIIVDAIVGEDKASDDNTAKPKGDSAPIGDNRTDRFLFKHGPCNDKTKELLSSLTGEPLANTVVIDGEYTEDGKPVTYYRHKVGFSVNGAIQEYFFFSTHDNLYSSTDESLLDIWSFIHSRQGGKSVAPKQKDAVEIMFFGGSMDGKTKMVACGPGDIPSPSIVYPMGATEAYHLHSAKIGIDGIYQTYYFYSLRSDYKDPSNKMIVKTLGKIIGL